MPPTCEFELDLDSWRPVPTQWPADDVVGVDDWAASVVDLFAVGEDRELAVAMVAAAVRIRQSPDFPADASFLWVGGVDLPPTMLDLGLLDAVGDPASRHRALCRADEDGAVGAVQVDEVSARHLGEGLSVLRFDPVDVGEHTVVTGTLRCCWRVGEVDVLVDLNAADPGTLVARVGAMTAFVDTLRVV